MKQNAQWCVLFTQICAVNESDVNKINDQVKVDSSPGKGLFDEGDGRLSLNSANSAADIVR